MTMKPQGGGSFIEDAFPHKLGRLYLPAHAAAGLITAAGVSTSLGVGGQHAEAAPAAAEISGVSMATSDELYFALHMAELNLADLSMNMQAAIWFVNSGTESDDGIDWTLIAKGVANGALLSDAKVSPDATITFPAVDNIVTNALTRTKYEKLALGGLVNDDAMLLLAATLADQGTTTGDELILLGVELVYTRAIFSADEMRQRT